MGLLVTAVCARSMNLLSLLCLSLGMLEMQMPWGLNSGHCLHDKGFTLLTEPFLQLLMSYLVGCGEIAIFGSSAQGNQQERWALTQMVLDKQT